MFRPRTFQTSVFSGGGHFGQIFLFQNFLTKFVIKFLKLLCQYSGSHSSGNDQTFLSNCSTFKLLIKKKSQPQQAITQARRYS